MKLMLDIAIDNIEPSIAYGDKILLIGSCFTRHIGDSLKKLKFDVLQNPNGILFGPESIGNSLMSYVQNYQYQTEDLFPLDELWHSWRHHSDYSQPQLKDSLQMMNASQSRAHTFLKEADWLIVTFGSAYTYELTEWGRKNSADSPAFLKSISGFVANCHRAPANWFTKLLLPTAQIIAIWEESIAALQAINPKLKIIFSISPVRHIRDGVVGNNRSKARLIDAVHHLCEKNAQAHYFPAYELLIDVWRDYRFYDSDLVHPNYLATEMVLEKFAEAAFAPHTQQIVKEMKELATAVNHKALHPTSLAHLAFRKKYAEKIRVLQAKYPEINFEKEMAFFAPF